ncbi:MAG: glycosyltransferase family 39 protein [Thermoanaerobaculia bacterium]|nr:glycosyltransferase family 39 protein [Thermoanaerobaculia bacterium]
MSGAEPSRRFTVAILPVLLVAWVARIEFIVILPSYAYSWDISSWQKVAELLRAGTNPYATTNFLNWPPLWMLCLFVLGRLAELGSMQFIDVLRGFLIAAESVGIVLVAILAGRLAPAGSARSVLLAGLALNPITILLTCQHGNFDALVVIWVMAALLALSSYHRSGEPSDWLLACLFLGLGVLTKTIPIALTPLLLPGARAATRATRAVGAALLLGPAALGMGVLFVLSPGAIVANVIRYSSAPGRFGVSGLAANLGLSGWLPGLSAVSSLALVALLAWGCVKAWSWTEASDRKMVLLAGLILLAIPTLGPGFGPQYAFWFIPPLAVSYLSGSTRWKVALVVAYAVSAATYVVLYGFARDLGGALVYLWWSPVAQSLGATITRNGPRAWLTLPMFVSWVVLLIFGVRELRAMGAVTEVAE